MALLEHVVQPQEEGLRTKDILAGMGLSRREISRLHTTRSVFRNGENEGLASIVHAGDVVSAHLSGKAEGKALRMQGHVKPVYECERFVVVDKPSGMPCHASREHPNDDMATLLTRQYGKNARPIGRLDKDVSGLMLYAFDQETAAFFHQQRNDGNLAKTYVAILDNPLFGEGRLEFHLGKQKGTKGRKVMEEGKPCAMRYWALPGRMVRIVLETGRTHQIRAGLAGLGHPLAGDKLYGGDTREIERVALHCASLRLVHPDTGKIMEFQSPCPLDMRKLQGEENEVLW